MTLIKPDGNGGTAHEMLRVAAEHYRRALAAFERSTDRIESDLEAPSPASEKLARQFGLATSVLFKEKQKIEDSIKQDAGIVHDFAIDFDQARREIRRRMARLRSAADAGELSG